MTEDVAGEDMRPSSRTCAGPDAELSYWTISKRLRRLPCFRQRQRSSWLHGPLLWRRVSRSEAWAWRELVRSGHERAMQRTRRLLVSGDGAMRSPLQAPQ